MRGIVRTPCYHRSPLNTRVISRRPQRLQPEPPPAANLPETLQFMRLLWAIVHGLQKASKRMASELGVTGPQRLALRVLGLYPGVSAGTLARILHVHPSTLTGVLQRLAKRGLLRRAADHTDRRRTVLFLTARGERVNRADRRTVESAIAAALNELGRPDARAAGRALAVIFAHMESCARPLAGRRPTNQVRKTAR
jgi:DNA-binding MarR family transcriptional regulator